MRLDLVIPAHNEAERIGPTIVEYLEVLGSEDRILVALDSCTDGTAEVVGEVAGGDPRVVLCGYPKLGKGGVIIETFRRCTADVVGFVDADGATPPGELLRLRAVVEGEGLDGAIAGRRHPSAVLPRGRSWKRRVASWGFAFGVRWLFGLPFSDTQCGAKVLRRWVVEGCLPLLSARDFLFDVDLLLVAGRLGARVVEVPTVWIDRDRSRVDVLGDSRRMALSSFSLWLHHLAVPLPTVPPASVPPPTIPPASVPALGALPAPALRALPEPGGSGHVSPAALQAAAAAAARTSVRRARGVVGGDA